MWTAHHRRVDNARNLQIIYETALTNQQSSVLAARDWLPDVAAVRIHKLPLVVASTASTMP